jgi:hypothetical protein
MKMKLNWVNVIIELILYTWDLSDDDDDSCALCGFSVLSVSVYERDMQQMIEREREGVAEKWIMCIWLISMNEWIKAMMNE